MQVRILRGQPTLVYNMQINKAYNIVEDYLGVKDLIASMGLANPAGDILAEAIKLICSDYDIIIEVCDVCQEEVVDFTVQEEEPEIMCFHCEDEADG